MFEGQKPAEPVDSGVTDSFEIDPAPAECAAQGDHNHLVERIPFVAIDPGFVHALKVCKDCNGICQYESAPRKPTRNHARQSLDSQTNPLSSNSRTIAI